MKVPSFLEKLMFILELSSFFLYSIFFYLLLSSIFFSLVYYHKRFFFNQFMFVNVISSSSILFVLQYVSFWSVAPFGYFRVLISVSVVNTRTDILNTWRDILQLKQYYTTNQTLWQSRQNDAKTFITESLIRPCTTDQFAELFLGHRNVLRSWDWMRCLHSCMSLRYSFSPIQSLSCSASKIHIKWPSRYVFNFSRKLMSVEDFSFVFHVRIWRLSKESSSSW